VAFHPDEAMSPQGRTRIVGELGPGRLLCLAWAGRWVLDRRRLAGWEAAWAAVGPHWTKRFRSRG
jgi:hypothetical protein